MTIESQVSQYVLQIMDLFISYLLCHWCFSAEYTVGSFRRLSSANNWTTGLWPSAVQNYMKLEVRSLFFRWTTSYSHPARPTSPPSACWERRARSRMHNRLLRVGRKVGKAFILFKSESRNVGNCRAAEYEYILLCLIRSREAKKCYSFVSQNTAHRSKSSYWNKNQIPEIKNDGFLLSTNAQVAEVSGISNWKVSQSNICWEKKQTQWYSILIIQMKSNYSNSLIGSSY